MAGKANISEDETQSAIGDQYTPKIIVGTASAKIKMVVDKAGV
jgi:hypothetical protein